MGKTAEQLANEQRMNNLLAEMAKLKAENERLAKERDSARKQAVQAMSMSVSAKGGVSVYGLGRFPVTLYKGQWRRLLAKASEVLAYVDEAEKLGALAPDDKDVAFVQPNGLPLKFQAKQAAPEKTTPKAGAAL